MILQLGDRVNPHDSNCNQQTKKNQKNKKKQAVSPSMSHRDKSFPFNYTSIFSPITHILLPIFCFFNLTALFVTLISWYLALNHSGLWATIFFDYFYNQYQYSTERKKKSPNFVLHDSRLWCCKARMMTFLNCHCQTKPVCICACVTGCVGVVSFTGSPSQSIPSEFNVSLKLRLIWNPPHVLSAQTNSSLYVTFRGCSRLLQPPFTHLPSIPKESSHWKPWIYHVFLDILSNVSFMSQKLMSPTFRFLQIDWLLFWTIHSDLLTEDRTS